MITAFSLNFWISFSKKIGGNSAQELKNLARKKTKKPSHVEIAQFCNAAVSKKPKPASTTKPVAMSLYHTGKGLHS